MRQRRCQCSAVSQAEAGNLNVPFGTSPWEQSRCQCATANHSQPPLAVTHWHCQWQLVHWQVFSRPGQANMDDKLLRDVVMLFPGLTDRLGEMLDKHEVWTKLESECVETVDDWLVTKAMQKLLPARLVRLINDAVLGARLASEADTGLSRDRRAHWQVRVAALFPSHSSWIPAWCVLVIPGGFQPSESVEALVARVRLNIFAWKHFSAEEVCARDAFVVLPMCLSRHFLPTAPAGRPAGFQIQQFVTKVPPALLAKKLGFSLRTTNYLLRQMEEYDVLRGVCEREGRRHKLSLAASSKTGECHCQ
jgi:hypothetical protein